MNRPIRLLLGVTLALLAGCAPPEAFELKEAPATEEAQQEVGVKTYRLFHWNVAGHALHAGSTSSSFINAIASAIVNQNADLVSINELCRNQYNALITELTARGWASTNFARFAEYWSTNSGVCSGSSFGVALFTRSPFGTSETLSLTEPTGSKVARKLLCAPLANPSRLRMCTVHLTTDTNFQQLQLDQVRTRLNQYHASGDTVFLAGDLNVQPWDSKLDNWYASSVNSPHNSNNRGLFRELDDKASNCPGHGEVTFTGRNGSPCTSTGRKGEPCSDHKLLSASVPVKIL